MKIIGLVGKKGSGKTTMAGFIKEAIENAKSNHICVVLSFGNKLKRMLMNAGICEKEELWGQKTPHSRRMLQIIGTELIRKQVDPDFFCRDMKHQLRDIQLESKIPGAKEPIVIIDDVRFLNEAKLVTRHNGVLFGISRPSLQEQDPHQSETEMETICCPVMILNGADLESLKKSAEQVAIFIPTMKDADTCFL